MSTIPYLIGSKQYGANLRMQNLAWNMANTSVPGHQTTDLSFDAVDIPSQDLSSDGLNRTVYPVQGVQWKNRNAGPLQKTDNPFNLAIQGPAYFEMADGTYTRDGSFSPNLEGTLVSTVDGMAILDVSGDPIVIPPGMKRGDFTVASNGQIANQEGELIGQLKLVEFDNINLLRNAGNNRLRSDTAPTPATQSQVLQGMIEGSNGQIPLILVNASSTKTDYQILGAMSRRYDELQQQTVHQLLHVQA